ncbi:hypothetical protein NIE88_13670 [Sporolactobacillus shoreicorticis]|uniref:FeoB-associated Cys-rich membrane protein n=1 Tax=Sporolactobacillus shoreicorticis TaxID=1923877 RepID=A0ABW5S070_9BACL|nr:hypothetical protein [Sporolactobacillus shoreicorticis]MCO7126815.1 hypothetical protein [Sporolactobacillus shoreicorticis]
MNLSTLLVLLMIGSMYFLAIRYVKRNKNVCTDCGLSGSCPIENLKQNARHKPCSITTASIRKPTTTELRAMIRK